MRSASAWPGRSSRCWPSRSAGRARVAGQPVTAAVWFASLRYLAALVRFAADPGDVTTAVECLTPAVAAFDAFREQWRRTPAGTPTALRRMPTSAALAAVVIATAVPVLTTRSQRQAGDRVAPLAEAAARRRREDRHDPLRGLAPPAPLDTVLRAVTPPSRVAGAMPTPSALEVGWQIRHLPHLVDAGDYTTLVAGHVPGTAAVTGRRMAAPALARLAGAASWRAAAEAMGMAARWARLDTYLSRRIGDAAGFWTAVTAVGRRLTTRGLVDYAARRHALRGLLEVPHRVLFAVCHPLGFPVTAARRRHAAAWVWEQVTGGDVREAPALVTFGAGVAAESVREVHRRFVRWLSNPLAEALRGWAAGYLTARSTA